MSHRCLLSALAILALSLSAWAQERPVRIGIYDNPPKIFLDASGKASGFHAAILEAIMGDLGLSYEFVHGTWAEGLERLASGGIDVMVDVAYSDERARLYDFNEETVFINWGVVYSRAGLEIESFIDLGDLRIAGMVGSIHTDGPGGLLALAKSFGLSIAFVPVANYDAAFRAVEQGLADAAVVNRIYGLAREGDSPLKRTNVFFNPDAIKYAFTKGGPMTARLVAAFDRALARLKADPGSAYYRAIEEYLPGFSTSRSVLPAWLGIAGLLALVLVAVSFAFIAILSREVGKRRRTEEALVRAKEAAESASRAKSAFLANTTHEIRTPMNAILGYAQILASDPSLSRGQRSFLEKIAEGGDHLLSIINEILDMSKIESGRIILDESAFDLGRAIDEAASMAGARAAEKGVALRVEAPSGPSRYAVGDEGKIRQVVLNLVGNAVKFTERGEVRLSASAGHAPGRSDGKILLSCVVSDSGPGIPEADLERIFEPFEQSLPERGTREGTGLGLSISRKLARLMGGDVTAANRPSGGSEFTFTAILGLRGAGDILAEGRRDRKGHRRVMRFPPGLSVLVADDRESNREILIELLRPYGFEIMAAADGAEALRVFETRRPSIVFMDLSMPVMDGVEALRRIRAMEAERSWKRTPVFAVTASCLEEEKGRVMRGGADDFIMKPFRLYAILEAIARFYPCEYGEERRSTPVASAGPEALRDELAALDPATRAALDRALTIGDVGRLRALAAEWGKGSPALSREAARAAERFDFRILAEAIAPEEAQRG